MIRSIGRSVASPTALVLVAVLAAAAAPGAAASTGPASTGLASTDPYPVRSTQNPILADGRYYSADPAPLVVPAGAPGADGGHDELYVYTGHDEAGPAQNDFVMNEWGALRTSDPGAGEWTHHPSLMRPEDVFDWASPGRAYAGEVERGPDGRYYWYVPVHEADSPADDKFGIGVAVSDTPTGPWTDHAGGPVVSQREPTPNTTHNIDPTVLVDGSGDDARVFMYWGSFGQLRRLELATDMRTPAGAVHAVDAPRGFFEAPWLFERDGTYYLAYAGNDAGPDSECTPAVYHACIAYATAPAPDGPWTHRGTILDPVSSTTSHPGLVKLDGQWWMAYHTADAAGGGHFRRSVAIDRVEWDDTQSPPRIVPVEPTPAPEPDPTPRANVAQAAHVTVSNEPVPTQYWTRALNDELVRANPLPPDMWGTWTADNPPQQWVRYTWDRPVRVDGARIDFWSDSPAGSGSGVAPPSSWRLQYWDTTEGWVDVPGASGYPTGTDGYQDVAFDPVTTTQLRAVLDASTDGTGHAAVAVEEWMVLADQPESVAVPGLVVETGETEPVGDAVATYADGARVTLPVRWDALAAEDVAAPGEVTATGTALGYAAGRVTAPVTVVEVPTEGDTSPPEVTLRAGGSAGLDGWFRSAVRVHAEAVDDGGGRVTFTTRVDDGAPADAGPARATTVEVAGDGDHTVAVTATDRAQNTSEAVTLDVRVDATAPVTTGTLDEAARSVTIAADDATSGVARVEHSLDGGPFVASSGPVVAPDADRHVVHHRAVDAAGNVGTARSTTIPADISGPLTGNVAPLATATASYTAGWNDVAALNDGLDPAEPGQAQIWGTWSGDHPASQWAQYEWARPIRVTSAAVRFWADQPQGSGVGVAPPASWELSWWDDAAQEWAPVPHPSAAGTSTDALNEMTFDPVTTSRLRLTVHADGDGTRYSAVAASEWQVVADDPGTRPAATVTAEARCLPGRAVVVVGVTNEHGSPVDLTVETPFGTRDVDDVRPGGTATQRFVTREPALEPGEVTVTLRGDVDGAAAYRDVTVPYAGASCTR